MEMTSAQRGSRGRLAALLTLCVLLSVSTALLPMVSAAPRWITSNIAATALAAFAFGPWGGGLFAAVHTVAANQIGMGSGVIGYVLVAKALEGILIGLAARWTRVPELLRPVLAAGVLTVFMKPVSLLLAYYLGGYPMPPLLPWLQSEWGPMLSALPTACVGYAFSCLTGYMLCKMCTGNLFLRSRR